jgi:hypothetical protein
MIAVCEFVDGVNQGWIETSFKSVEEWERTLSAHGKLVLEKSLTSPMVWGYRLLDPPNKARIFRVALHFNPEEFLPHYQV